MSMFKVKVVDVSFLYLGFLSRTFTIYRTAGEGGGCLFNSSLPLHPLHRHLCFGDTSEFFMKLQQIFFVAIPWKFSFVSHNNLFMQQIGEKITLFLLSFFFSNMMSDVQVITAIVLLLDGEDEEKENVQERSQWVWPWIARRKSDGAFYTIFQELKQEDAEGFRGYVRLNTTSFEKLVELLAPSLLKKDTVMRECIKPEEMCCVALRYFASGESFRSLEYQFRISRKAIPYIAELQWLSKFSEKRI